MTQDGNQSIRNRVPVVEVKIKAILVDFSFFFDGVLFVRLLNSSQCSSPVLFIRVCLPRMCRNFFFSLFADVVTSFSCLSLFPPSKMCRNNSKLLALVAVFFLIYINKHRHTYAHSTKQFDYRLIVSKDHPRASKVSLRSRSDCIRMTIEEFSLASMINIKKKQPNCLRKVSRCSWMLSTILRHTFRQL